MNIWIDICHTPQYNFYKNFILRQASIGNTIYVTILDRGKTPQIIRHEIGDVAGVELFVIGKHRMKKWSAIFCACLSCSVGQKGVVLILSLAIVWQP